MVILCVPEPRSPWVVTVQLPLTFAVAASCAPTARVNPVNRVTAMQSRPKFNCIFLLDFDQHFRQFQLVENLKLREQSPHSHTEWFAIVVISSGRWRQAFHGRARVWLCV